LHHSLAEDDSMNKIGLALLAIAGVFVGGLGLMMAMRLRSEVAALKTSYEKDQAAISSLKSKVEGIDRKLAEGRPGERPSDLDSPRIERTPRSEPGTPAQAPSVTQSGNAGESVEEFAELQKKVLGGKATEEEREKFWKLTRDKPGLLDDIIKQLEKAAADSPRDKEALRRLSEAYLAKLMAVPDGMQKGTWSSKMIAAEKKILEIDPEDWEARFSVAVNYSFWPEQFNKRPDAIKEFETLKRIQESRPTDAKYAQTYLQLRQLYLKEGRSDDAKTVLEEGLRLFPNDAELIKARDGVK
jgi:tetratricopeptide (TPR) repeat protein